MPTKLNIVAGQRYGRLVTVRPAERRHGQLRWECACDCGAVTAHYMSPVYRGLIKSCGCLQRDVVKQLGMVHGQAARGATSSTYISWQAMLERCRNPKTIGYENYGGRGISVCERWRVFTNFLDDMGLRPAGTTIYRINTNGNYEKDNCRWATRTEQDRNRRNNVFVTFNDRTMTLQDWSKELGVSWGALAHRWQKYGDLNHKGSSSRPVKRVRQLSLDGTVIADFESSQAAAEVMKVTRSKIAKVCRGELKTAADFRWSYT